MVSALVIQIVTLVMRMPWLGNLAALLVVGLAVGLWHYRSHGQPVSWFWIVLPVACGVISIISGMAVLFMSAAAPEAGTMVDAATGVPAQFAGAVRIASIVMLASLPLGMVAAAIKLVSVMR